MKSIANIALLCTFIALTDQWLDFVSGVMDQQITKKDLTKTEKEQFSKLVQGSYGEPRNEVYKMVVKEAGELLQEINSSIETLIKTDKDHLIKGLKNTVEFIKTLLGTLPVEPKTEIGAVVTTFLKQIATYFLNYFQTVLDELNGGPTGNHLTQTDLQDFYKKITIKYYETLAKVKKDKDLLIENSVEAMKIYADAIKQLDNLHPVTALGNKLLVSFKRIAKKHFDINEIIFRSAMN